MAKEKKVKLPVFTIKSRNESQGVTHRLSYVHEADMLASARYLTELGVLFIGINPDKKTIVENY